MWVRWRKNDYRKQNGKVIGKRNWKSYWKGKLEKYCEWDDWEGNVKEEEKHTNSNRLIKI